MSRANRKQKARRWRTCCNAARKRLTIPIGGRRLLTEKEQTVGNSKAKGGFFGVSRIAPRYGSTAEDVNLALQRLGYLKGKPGKWLPTEKGEKISVLRDGTDKQTGKPMQWYEWAHREIHDELKLELTPAGDIAELRADMRSHFAELHAFFLAFSQKDPISPDELYVLRQDNNELKVTVATLEEMRASCAQMALSLAEQLKAAERKIVELEDELRVQQSN